MKVKIILFLVVCVVQKIAGQLRCYACGFSSMDSDRSCLTVTNDTQIINCQYTYCTILRQEYQDPIGVVASFTRGCEEDPDYLNHEVSDPTFKTFYRACTTNFCNVGDGVQSVTGGNLSPTPEYNGLNLLVPGTGSAVSVENNLSLLLILLLSMCLFL